MPRAKAPKAAGVLAALEASLVTVPALPADSAAIELAREYARMIDLDSESLWRLGPRLLETLVELGMTPKARAAVVKDGGKPAVESGLDELRARREQRGAK